MARLKRGIRVLGGSTTAPTRPHSPIPIMSATGHPTDFSIAGHEPQYAEKSLKGGSAHITYTEHRGIGVPSTELGVDGDVYIDIEHKKVYVRAGTWAESTINGTNAHPTHPSHHLWFNVNTFNIIGWYNARSRSNLSYKARKRGDDDITPDTQEAVKMVLRKELPSERQQKDAKRHYENRASNPRRKKKAKIDSGMNKCTSGQAGGEGLVASTSQQPAPPVIDPVLVRLSDARKFLRLCLLSILTPNTELQNCDTVYNLPSDILIRGRVGKEFPLETPVVKWKNGLQTASAIGGQEVNVSSMLFTY